MAKKKSKGNDDPLERTPQLVEHISDSSDEEIDEDEAFNSDDELRYGSLFQKNGKKKETKHSKSSNESDSSDDDGSYSISASDDDDDDSLGLAGSDDDEEEGDGGQYMLDLLNNLDNNSKDDTKKKTMKEKRKEAALAMSHSGLMEESEYSAAAVNSTGLTMDQLMSGITDTKGFGTVQKTMGKMMSDNNTLSSTSKALTTTKAPVSRVVSERASRKVHYEEQKEDASRWTEVVKRNREAETLDFRPKDRAIVTRDELVSKFQPTTDFERELAEVLEKAGVSNENEMLKQEQQQLLADEFDDDLGGSKLTMKEYKERMGELSKMRALMFYDEQKRHHINKIKSKKYRKIRKKKRDKMKDAEQAAAADEDPDLAREIEEKQEMERMKERMTLAHKNTSKWAKRVLRRGGNIDMDTRKALSAQLRIGDDLRNKMMGEMESDDSDNENDKNLIDQAKMLLADTEKSETSSKGKSNALLEMTFMKKGAQAQRQKAKEEARQLLQELEGNEDYSSDSSNSAKSVESTNSKPKKKKATSVKNTEKVLSKGALVAKSLQFGNSNTISVGGSVGIDIDFLDTQNAKTNKNKIDHSDKHNDNFKGEFTLPNSDMSKTLSKEKKEKKTEKAITFDDKTNTNLETSSSQDNPWLQPESDSDEDIQDENKNSERKKPKPFRKSTKSDTVDISGAVHIVTSDDGSEDKVLDNGEGKSNASDMAKDDGKLVTLSQDELVRRAFASPTEDEVDAEFEKEKEAMRERDDPSKKQKQDKNSVSGWGSWTGQGAPIPRPPKALPNRLKPPTKKEKKRKRQDDKKKNVIINEKRLKKNAQYQIANIPYPFTSREQYERAMCGGVGYEWNVTGAVKSMTRAEVITRTGKIIQPINKKSKSKNKRAPAKF